MFIYKKKFCTFFLVLVMLLAFKAYAVDLFKAAPKIQIYDAGKKVFLYRDKVQKTDEQWASELPKEIYVIVRNKGTELAFTGKYWNNHEKGVYQCYCCGIDLFTSDAKFDTDTGLPSFDRPVMETNIILKEDKSPPIFKIEVMCVRCEAHLGYLLSDESRQTRKCYLINSAALKFKKSDNQLQ